MWRLATTHNQVITNLASILRPAELAEAQSLTGSASQDSDGGNNEAQLKRRVLMPLEPQAAECLDDSDSDFESTYERVTRRLRQHELQSDAARFARMAAAGKDGPPELQLSFWREVFGGFGGDMCCHPAGRGTRRATASAG